LALMGNKKPTKDTRRKCHAATKLTEDERSAWDRVCASLGGDVRALSDADGIRHAMSVLARQCGVAWPGGAS
jgi:hypothetical protein